jgi:5-methylcytosine-specific restriction endonuclease McrA
MAATRRIRAGRFFSSWTDAEGAFCFKGRDTADRGARILEHLGHAATVLQKERRAGADVGSGPEGPISRGALWADAFFALATRQGADPEAPADQLSADALRIITRPPTCTTILRVDVDALFRGRVLPGEQCEIDGQGPIPVPMARDLANDSFLAVLFHRAGDIRAVSHLGRTINATLRTALVYRDRTCVVPGCGVSQGLEIDHVTPISEGGPTELENLALLCYHHHQEKTHGGWVLTRVGTGEGGRPTWTFEPQPAFGQEPGLGIDSDEGRAEWRRQRE